MTSDEALAIWKQSGFGKTYWTFEFAQAVERKTLDSVLSILDEYEHGIDHVVKLIRELSELPQPVAQTEWDDELEALKADNASLLDSLTRESVARCEAEDMLRRIPTTPEMMIQFIGSNFNSMEAPGWTDGLPSEPTGDLSMVRYSLTVHDLLSVFDWADLGKDSIDATLANEREGS